MVRNQGDFTKSPKAIQKERLQQVRKRISKYSAKFEDGIIDLKVSPEPMDRRKALDILSRLENETMYIPASLELTIKVDLENKENETNQINSLKEGINHEIIKILYHENQELRRVKIVSIILFLVGITTMLIASLLNFKDFFTQAVQQLFVISSWVFIWESIDKMVFVRHKLVKKKLKLFQLYFAEYELQ
jgi:hypothetical protein